MITLHAIKHRPLGVTIIAILTIIGGIGFLARELQQW